MLDPFKRSGVATWTLTALLLVLALGLVALVLWALVKGVESHPEIVVPVAAVLVAFLGNLLIQRRVEREKRHERRREELAPLAANLFKFIRRTAKSDSPDPSTEDEETLTNIQDGIMLWGSKSMVAAWAGSMRTIAANPESNEAALAVLIDLLHSVRVELGHDDTGLEKRDLMRLFLTDPDAHIPAGNRF